MWSHCGSKKVDTDRPHNSTIQVTPSYTMSQCEHAQSRPFTLSPPFTNSAFGTAFHPLTTSTLVPQVPSPADFPYKYHRSYVLLSYRIPNRALKHIPMRAVLLLVHIFNAILCTHHFPTISKHTRVISVLKPGKDPAQPHPIDPLVSWTQLANCSRKSCLPGYYMK